VFEHVPVATLHRSVVHASPSLQSAAVVQQPGTSTGAQVWVPTSHVSVMQWLGSTQFAFDVQQFVIGELVHVLVARSHVSCVQILLSLQSLSLRQQPGSGMCKHMWFGKHRSAVHVLPSLQSPCCVQH
jgi:hypothetical protein